jgi:hypothetical protein
MMGTEFVKIFAGKKLLPDTKKFSAHKDLVCKASAVLAQRLQFQASNWPSEQQNELYFDDDESSIDVQDFINLLYRDRKAIFDRVRTYEEYLQLYQFADKFEVDGLRDIAIDGLQDRLKMDGLTFSFMYDVKWVFAFTSKGPKNKLHRFYTALLVHEHLVLGTKDTEYIMKEMGWYPDLLEDWLAFQQSEHYKRPTLRYVGTDPRNRVKSDSNVAGFPLCYFHVHPPEQVCTTKANYGPT